MLTAHSAHRPVFLLGPPRSGAGLLAWGLGQHSRLRAIAEGGWIGRLSLDLEATLQRASAGRPAFPPGAEPRSRSPFFRRCGRVVLEELLPDRHLRGVRRSAGPSPSGTPPAAPLRRVSADANHAFYVQGLLSLWPGAKFVFVLRDVGSVVHALVNLPAPDGAYYTEESACALWLRTVEACLEAERAHGSGVVHRVDASQLAHSPEPVLRRCLEFLEEPYEAACLRPFRHGSGGAGMPLEAAPGPAFRSAARLEAERLSRELLSAPPARVAPDPRSQLRLAQQFRQQATHEAAGREAAASAPPSPVQQLRDVVRSAVPAAATVAVVSRGDEALLELGDRTAWHFPRSESGLYAGCYPADSTEAIRHLEDLRARGAEFLVFPCTAYWWLSHYPEFQRHLEERYRIVAFQEDSCLVFALRPAANGQTPGVSLLQVQPSRPAARRGPRRRDEPRLVPQSAPSGGE
jgi:hypothetical protein